MTLSDVTVSEDLNAPDCGLEHALGVASSQPLLLYDSRTGPLMEVFGAFPELCGEVVVMGVVVVDVAGSFDREVVV